MEAGLYVCSRHTMRSITCRFWLQIKFANGNYGISLIVSRSRKVEAVSESWVRAELSRNVMITFVWEWSDSTIFFWQKMEEPWDFAISHKIIPVSGSAVRNFQNHETFFQKENMGNRFADLLAGFSQTYFSSSAGC